MDLTNVVLFLAFIPFWGWLAGWCAAATIQRIAGWKSRLAFAVGIGIAIRMLIMAFTMTSGPDTWMLVANIAAMGYGFMTGPH